MQYILAHSRPQMQAEPLQPINMTTMKMWLLNNWNCIETFWTRWKIPVKCNFTSYVASSRAALPLPSVCITKPQPSLHESTMPIKLLTYVINTLTESNWEHFSLCCSTPSGSPHILLLMSKIFLECVQDFCCSPADL